MIKFLYCNNGTGIKLNEKKIMNAIPSEEEWKAQQKFYKKHSEEVYSTIVQEETIKYGLSREHFKIGIHIPNEEIAKGFSIEYDNQSFSVTYQRKGNSIITEILDWKKDYKKRYGRELTLIELKKDFAEWMIKVKSIDKVAEKLNRLKHWERGERREKVQAKIKNGFNSVLGFILVVTILALCAYLLSIMGGGSSTDHLYLKP